MIRITDRSHVPASPEREWAFFADLEARYSDWHPEHVEFRVIRGTPVAVGSVYFFDEWIGRFRLRTRARVAEAREQRFLRHEGMFPYSLLQAGGSFALEPAGDGGCDLVAEVYIGWQVPVLGAFLDRLIAAVVPLPDLRRHVAEEGRNLARLLARGSCI